MFLQCYLNFSIVSHAKIEITSSETGVSRVNYNTILSVYDRVCDWLVSVAHCDFLFNSVNLVYGFSCSGHPLLADIWIPVV